MTSRWHPPPATTDEGILVTYFHAVVWLDHKSAQVLQFDAEHVQAQKVKAHTHHTAYHGSGVRTEHEFFGEVCDALKGITEVLVTGSHTATADFRHYAEKHRAEAAKQIVGYETVDHPSEAQLVALARKYFLKYDRMAGTPTPT
jgi:stalled ribosome rescue protein Dom34